MRREAFLSVSIKTLECLESISSLVLILIKLFCRNETNFVDFHLLNPYNEISTNAIFDKKYKLHGKILGPDRKWKIFH